MAIEVIAHFPEKSIFVPYCFESIINKKVANAVLSILESFIHAILFKIYCPYYFLYQAKMSRVHSFIDKTPLYDCTDERIASITGNENNGRITILANQVFFPVRQNIELTFSQEHRTDFVLVLDDPRQRPNWVQVVEQEINFPDNTKPKEKIWEININETHRFEGREPVCDFYLAVPIL